MAIASPFSSKQATPKKSCRKIGGFWASEHRKRFFAPEGPAPIIIFSSRSLRRAGSAAVWPVSLSCSLRCAGSAAVWPASLSCSLWRTGSAAVWPVSLSCSLQCAGSPAALPGSLAAVGSPAALTALCPAPTVALALFGRQRETSEKKSPSQGRTGQNRGFTAF